MWRSFNNEIGRGKKPTVINHLIQNGEKIQDPEKIGNMLCDFYACSPQSSDPDRSVRSVQRFCPEYLYFILLKIGQTKLKV